jgi:hypothetical protein
MKFIAITLAAIVGLVLASCYGVAKRDDDTRTRLLEQVAKELPIGSDERAMQDFMRTHTVSYSLDERFNHQYSGVLPQSWLDRHLSSRKVFLRLKLSAARKFAGAEVVITYRGL